MFCIDDLEKVKLANNTDTGPINTMSMININKCLWGDCATSEEEYKEFFSTFYIQPTYLLEQIDWSIYGEKPVKLKEVLGPALQLTTEKSAVQLN